MRGRKGQISLYIMWFFMAVILLLIASFIAPLGVNLNAAAMGMGEDMLIRANDTIQGLTDADVKAAIQDVNDEAVAYSSENIQLLSYVYRYSWVIVLVLSALILFMYTRTVVEFGGGGFV